MTPQNAYRYLRWLQSRFPRFNAPSALRLAKFSARLCRIALDHVEYLGRETSDLPRMRVLEAEDAILTDPMNPRPMWVDAANWREVASSTNREMWDASEAANTFWKMAQAPDMINTSNDPDSWGDPWAYRLLCADGVMRHVSAALRVDGEGAAEAKARMMRLASITLAAVKAEEKPALSASARARKRALLSVREPKRRGGR